MLPISLPRPGTVVLALLSLLLASCLFAPGRFTSSLDVRKDGTFSFAYTGEIHMLALSKMAGDMGGGSKTFEAQPCYKDDGLEQRDCTKTEIAEQKQRWEEERAQSEQKRKRDAESAKAFFGGIDPSDPRAAEEVAQRLRRQAGWKKVTYKGDGLFEVDYAIAGRLDHDFTFPTIERFPMANAFVQVTRRSDGTIRIDAPGFAPAGDAPMRSMMGVVDKDTPPPPEFDGTFTIRTDGAILVNNTDTGPQADPTGQRLDWTVNLRTPAAPAALIRLAR